MINRPTRFKNTEKLSCIDLILRKCPRTFQKSCAIEKGLSDFIKLTVTIVTTTYTKLQPKIIIYRRYKFFNNDGISEELLQIKANGNNCEESFQNFQCNPWPMSRPFVILNKHAPQKK